MALDVARGMQVRASLGACPLGWSARRCIASLGAGGSTPVPWPAGAGGAHAADPAPRPQAQQRGACHGCRGCASRPPIHSPLCITQTCPLRCAPPPPQFIDSTGTAKIADFGLARILSPAAMVSLTGETGSYLWMAPEVIRQGRQDAWLACRAARAALGNPAGCLASAALPIRAKRLPVVPDARCTRCARRHEPYDARSDCWSFGVMLVELLTQQKPYAALYMTPVQVAIQVRGAGPGAGWWGEPLPPPLVLCRASLGGLASAGGVLPL